MLLDEAQKHGHGIYGSERPAYYSMYITVIHFYRLEKGLKSSDTLCVPLK